MDLRLEFVMLARQPGANVAALCRRFGISRKTGYKWLRRVGSRNPCRPSSTPPSIRSAASSMADGSASRARRSNCPRHSPDTRSVSCPPPATASGTSSSRAAISPNSTGDRAQQKLLPMSPNTCNPCLRSVHLLGGRNNLDRLYFSSPLQGGEIFRARIPPINRPYPRGRPAAPRDRREFRQACRSPGCVQNRGP